MKITHVTTRLIRTPADNPLVVGLARAHDTREFVTLELGTDQGLVGIGLTFFGGALSAALQGGGGCARARSPSARIRSQVEAVTAKLRRAAGSSGPGGIFTLALSAIDIALLGHQGQGARPVRLARCSAACATACRPTRAAP